MQIDATLTKEWKQRWLILTGFIFAGALWFFYDGFVGYPKMAERYQEYRQIADGLISSGKVSSEREMLVVDTWRDHATERGWEREVPKNKTRSDFDNQKKYGGFLVLVTFALLGWYHRSSRQSVHYDGTTITGADGTRVEAARVHELDKRKWKNKGIVYALYRDGDKDAEKSKKLTLDAYKFGGVENIVEDLDGRLNA